MLTAGATPVYAVSEAQRAYDACVDSYNSTFRFKGNYKAIVAGVGANGSTRCFWTWGAKSVGAAQRSAFASCGKKFRKCFLYADSNGNSSWSRRISNMGGSDGSRENDAAAGAAVGGFIAGMAGAIISNGGGGSTHYSGGGGGGNYDCHNDGQGPGTCAAR